MPSRRISRQQKEQERQEAIAKTMTIAQQLLLLLGLSLSSLWDIFLNL